MPYFALIIMFYHVKIACYHDSIAIFLVNNPSFHEHTNHIEIGYHTIFHQVLTSLITTPYIHSSHKLTDILFKGLSMTSFFTN